MKLYPSGYEVSVTVKFTDNNGDPVAPSDVSAALFDGDDALVVDFGALPFEAPAPGSIGEKEIIIPAVFSELRDGELSAARILRVTLTTPAGKIRRSFFYAIEGEFRLALMVNSFISYEAASLLTRDMVDTTGWAVADEERRHAALAEAFNRLTQIPMRFSTMSPEDRRRDPYGFHSDEVVIARSEWAHLTAEEFLEFPDHFRKALRLAQVTEANELLQGDTTQRKYRSGIVSETIGESSVTLRGGRLDYGVSSQTLKHLAGYIFFSMRIARA